MTNWKRASAVALTAIGLGAPAVAQDCFIGEVRMFAGNFAPRNWAMLDGQLLPISQNTALFSILGTTYGGDGRTTFALPDMRGRTVVHPGSGPGLAPVRLGEQFGSGNISLDAQQMPAHNHAATTTATLNASTSEGATSDPTGNFLANDGNDRVYNGGPANAQMNSAAVSATTTVSSAGNGAPVDVHQPSGAINHIICLTGYYPSRN